jgi:hypothetical protein
MDSPLALQLGKALSLAKSDAGEQKTTASFLEFDLLKNAKHWQSRRLTAIAPTARHWQRVCYSWLAKKRIPNREKWLREATVNKISNCSGKSLWLVAG